MKVTAAVLAATIGLATAVEPPTHTKQPPKPPGPPHDKPKGPPGPPPYGPSKKPSPPGKPTKTGGASYPTATAEPTGLPPVDSKALQGAISVDNLRAKAEHLEGIAYATDDRNRVIGSAGFNNTVEWLYESVEALGDYWTVYKQPFTALYSNVDGDITVDGVTFEPSFFEYSPGGTVTAELVPVADLGCEQSDYPAEVEGKIALISRGECPFGLKSALAGVAGAAGAVIYNNAPAPLGGGTLGPDNEAGPYVPTLGVSQANGTSWIERITGGEAIEATLDIDSDLYNITVENVIAETVGGNKDSVLVIGGHSDSVFAGPGINDDGSGIIGILEVAEQLTGYAVNNSVRIAFWAGEEFGLLGSWHYTENLSEEEAAKIRLYLNFDMIASPNYILGIYDGDGSAFNQTGPAGSAEAEHFFEDFFAENGLGSVPTDFSGRSDYAGFLARGIASGGLFTGAEVVKTEEEAELFGGEAGVSYDINYHQAGDNVTNLAWDAFEWNTKAIAASVAEYATTFESLGPANNTVAPNRKRSALPDLHHSHEGGCSKKSQ
ncbi:hypothetical protein Q7P37_003211 [Cladosporium fusiforme]